MEFAKQELAKYGWTEGKGLGRNETGIVKALKPLLKFDKAGMGHDSAETFTNHWWEKAFNAAADNITVNKYVDGSVTVDTENAFEIGDHKGTSKKRKHLVYDNFIKMATLTNEGGMAEEPREPEEVPVITAVPVLTDEELFRACGGRTAHKGARHGLGLNGKLARIEEQERLLLNLTEMEPEVVPISRRKKSKRSKVSEDVGVQTIESEVNVSKSIDKKIDISPETVNNENINHVKKVKKSKKSKKDEEAVEEITPSDEQTENNLKSKGHKKGRISVEVNENLNEINLNAEECNRKISKKVRREKEKSSEDAVEEGVEEKKGDGSREKKSKKSRDTLMEEEVVIEKPRKKSKKVTEDHEETMTETASPVPDKKEKRKKKKCPADNDVDATACMADATEDAIPKKKKKKSHRKAMAE